MSEWLPAVGDAVTTPHGPGEVIGMAAIAPDGSFSWGTMRLADGPYVVVTEDTVVRGYPRGLLRRRWEAQVR
jgi:hypothetical protein